MKYKIGDKVQIVKNNQTYVWLNCTKQYITGTIEQVNDDDVDKYYVKIDGYRGIYDNGWFAFSDEHLRLIATSDEEIKPIKSNGGSSSYYFSPLPKELIEKIKKTGGIEIKDIVRYCFDNDADCKDIIKALKRIREYLKGGGKEGVDAMYDANKIEFFAKELKEWLKIISKESK